MSNRFCYDSAANHSWKYGPSGIFSFTQLATTKWASLCIQYFQTVFLVIGNSAPMTVRLKNFHYFIAISSLIEHFFFEIFKNSKQNFLQIFEKSNCEWEKRVKKSFQGALVLYLLHKASQLHWNLLSGLRITVVTDSRKKVEKQLKFRWTD